MLVFLSLLSENEVGAVDSVWRKPFVSFVVSVDHEQSFFVFGAHYLDVFLYLKTLQLHTFCVCMYVFSVAGVLT